MKNILNLEGVKKLTKKEQERLSGGRDSFPYCNLSDQSRCCVRRGGREYCDYGQCDGYRCLYWD